MNSCIYLQILLIITICLTSKTDSRHFSNKRSLFCNNKENTEWKVAGTNCGKFCTELVSEVMVDCPKWRLNIGCFCKEGYYLNKFLNCVLPANCEEDPKPAQRRPDPPITCPENEIYDNCSSRCLEQCSKRDDPISCPITCDSGCFCRGARLRNSGGQCIDIKSCEELVPKPPEVVAKQCPAGEVYEQCSDRCKEMCPNVKNTLGRALDCTKCEGGCFCINGHMRNEKGNCIYHKKCDRKNALFKVMSSIFNIILNEVAEATE